MGLPSSLQLLFCCPFAMTGWISGSQGHQILQVSCIHPGNSKDLLLNLTILRLNPVVEAFFLILEANTTDKSNFILLTSYNPAKVKWKLLSPVWHFVTPWTDYTGARIFLGQNTGVCSLSLLKGIFPTQGSNPGLPDCRWILYQLSHKGSPITLLRMS